MRIITTLMFGRDGNSHASQQEGFAAPEDGFTWSVGHNSRLRVVAPAEADTVLELALNPFVVPGRLDAQRLVVDVNGVRVADERLRGEGTVAWRVPAQALRPDGQMDIALRHEEARSPAELGVNPGDKRVLGFMLRTLRVLSVPPSPPADVTVLPPRVWPADRQAMLQAVQAETGLAPHELAMCFESLGHNCEFGLVQRHLGAEPHGLLRFAGIALDDLLAGLERGFAGVGEAVVVRTVPAGNGGTEYLICDDRYRIGLHTFGSTADGTAEQVRAKHGGRLQFLAGHFREWLRNGERVFVVQRPGQLTRSQALALLVRLRSFGPNGLLYVDTEPGMPSGAIEQIEHGLFHGRLDQLAPAEEAGLSDLPGWLSLLANVHTLRQAARPA